MNKIYSRPDICYVVHVVGGIFILVCALLVRDFNNALSYILLVTAIILNLISIYLLYFFALTYFVCFDENKLRTNNRKKSIELSWSEINDCIFGMSMFAKFNGTIKFISNDKKLKLIFNLKTYNLIIKHCSNELITKKIKQIWDSI